MTDVVLIRHGQARLEGTDYGGLTEVGREQARALGRTCARRGAVPERVIVGPRARHVETAALAQEAAREEGCPWPEPEVEAAWDEYPAFEILAHAVHAGELPPPGGDAPWTFLEGFLAVADRWVRGELVVPGVETYRAFRARVEGGLAALTARREKAFVFTSGGPVAAAVGAALELDDPKTHALSWELLNTSISQVRRDRRGLRLTRFNALPHLEAPHLATPR